MGYLGKKPGVDAVTFTFSLSNCSGTADYDVIANPPTVFSVGWGQDAWSKGACTAKGRLVGSGREWLYYHRKQCVEDPIDEETGAFQTAASDAQLPSPGVPFDFRRTYSSDDTQKNAYLGWGWSFPYYAAVSVDTSVMPYQAKVLLGDGRVIVYAQRSDGTWAPPSWTTATLTQSCPWP